MFGIGGKHENKGLQLLIRDDTNLQFRQQKLNSTFIVEEEDGEVVNGWKHLFGNQWTFGGGEGLPSGHVTVSTERDYLLELLPGIIPESEKPTRATPSELMKSIRPQEVTTDPFLVEVGRARAFDILVEKLHSRSYEKVTQYLGLGLLGMIFALIVKILISRIGG